MVSGSLARRYAKAMFDLATTPAARDSFGNELRAIAKAMHESNELITLLANPAIRKGDRRKVLDALLARIGAQQLIKNLVNLLLDGERLATLPAISRELDAMIAAKSNKVTAEIVSAKPLDPAQLSQITATLQKLSGKQVTVNKREDPALLGGVVAKIGDTVYDGSLRTQLRNLRDDLAK